MLLSMCAKMSELGQTEILGTSKCFPLFHRQHRHLLKTLRAVRELLSILDRSGFEFSRSRFLADPLTRHPPKPVCLDFDVRLRQSVGMSGVGMSRARAQVHKFTVSRE